MKIFSLFIRGKQIIPAALVSLILSINLSAEDQTYNYYYRIYFIDKGENKPENYSPSDLLSDRALDRRLKYKVTVPDVRDIPVNRQYINEIISRGLALHCSSKWMNTALFKTNEAIDEQLLLDLPSVSGVKLVKKPVGKSNFAGKLDLITEADDKLQPGFHIAMLNGASVHLSGYDGRGILIAVTDGGFLNADRIPSLDDLRSRKGIKYTYDFVRNDPFVYGYHTHGTAVMSILAGQIPGILEGTATGADYMLFRTEDTESESAAEEDFWVAAAEFADSAGADIITSSLGYFHFDDPSLDYSFSDMDGNTAFITKAADIAVSKGIMVFSSAGNERSNEWQRIIAPSDGDSVICVGAVDSDELISYFSSAGPSADGRVKPDNVALGVNVIVQTSINEVFRSSGTSFSCPVLSGMAACIMQAVPGATPGELTDALHRSADRFLIPDSLYGYGIPDMIKVLSLLQDIHLREQPGATVAKPNPTTGSVEILFREPPANLTIEIYSASGIILSRKKYSDFAGRNLVLSDLGNYRQGIYFVRLITGTGTYLHKIIKTGQ
jgi:subtilisin family serine protease